MSRTLGDEFASAKREVDINKSLEEDPNKL